MAKQFTLISLLIIMISACTQQITTATPPREEVQSTQTAPSNTFASTPPTFTSSPDLAATERAITPPTALPSPLFVDTATAAFSLCPGAPGPYAAMGNQVTVISEDVDKLKLRSEPKISDDNVLRELNRFTQLSIVGGPVCVHSSETGTSYWFWQVKAPPDGEIGWVAEGDVQHSFIVVSIGRLYAGFTATAYTAVTTSACMGPHAPVSTGGEVTVMTENTDKLKLRSEPKISPNTVIQELDQFTQLQIVGGPLCVTSAETGISYWFWKVKVIPRGKTGWIAEGDEQNEFIDPNIPP